MLGEAIAAVLVGMAGLLLVLLPLFRPSGRVHRPDEPLDPEETPRGVALTALKEIDFDRETGKLSDADYEFLKAKYTAIALEALRAEQSPPPASQQSCRSCGPRPEPDAIFCSTLWCAFECRLYRRAGEHARRNSARPPPRCPPILCRPTDPALAAGASQRGRLHPRGHRPHRLVVAGAADVMHDSRLPRLQPANEDVVPGEHGDAGPDPLGEPAIAMSHQKWPDPFAVEVAGYDGGPAEFCGIVEDGLDLVPAALVGNLDLRLQVHRVRQDPLIADP